MHKEPLGSILENARISIPAWLWIHFQILWLILINQSLMPFPLFLCIINGYYTDQDETEEIESEILMKQKPHNVWLAESLILLH